MKRNVGMADMLVRLLISIALFYIGFFDNPIVSAGTSQTIIRFIAIVPLATGFLRFCPLYTLIGLNTCSKCQDK